MGHKAYRRRNMLSICSHIDVGNTVCGITIILFRLHLNSVLFGGVCDIIKRSDWGLSFLLCFKPYSIPKDETSTECTCAWVHPPSDTYLHACNETKIKNLLFGKNILELNEPTDRVIIEIWRSQQMWCGTGRGIRKCYVGYR